MAVTILLKKIGCARDTSGHVDDWRLNATGRRERKATSLVLKIASSFLLFFPPYIYIIVRYIVMVDSYNESQHRQCDGNRIDRDDDT